MFVVVVAVAVAVAVAVDVAVAVAVAVVVVAAVVVVGGGGFACPMHSTEKFATTVLSKCVCVLRGTNGLLDAHFEGGDMCKCSHHPFRQRQKKTTASYIMAGASWHESIP